MAGGALGRPEPSAAQEEPRGEEADGAKPQAAGGSAGAPALRMAKEEPANVVWTQEPRPYYSWIWADVAIRPDPLDLGHGGADPESPHWSPWLSREAAVKDLQLYRTADNFGRPLEMRMAAARGEFSAEEVEKQLLPGSKRFLSKFESTDEAVSYLTGGGTGAMASTTPLTPRLATARKAGADEVTPNEQNAAGSARTRNIVRYFMVGVFGCLVCILALVLLGYFIDVKIVHVRECRVGDDEETSSEEELERGSGGANPWQAFMDAPREGEMRRLLVFIEQGPQELPPLPPLPQLPDDGRAAAGPSQRQQAEAEVERIIAARDVVDIFGAGDAASRKQEFRRLLRLIHPDKGLVSGQRAALALRRVVEAYRTSAGRD